MSIRPIDLQVLIPRTEEIGRKQQGQQDKNQAESQKFMLQFQEQAKNRQSQVQTSQKSEQEKINQEKKEKSNQGKKQGKNNKKNLGQKDELADPVRGTLIDIKT